MLLRHKEGTHLSVRSTTTALVLEGNPFSCIDKLLAFIGSEHTIHLHRIHLSVLAVIARAKETADVEEELVPENL